APQAGQLHLSGGFASAHLGVCGVLQYHHGETLSVDLWTETTLCLKGALFPQDSTSAIIATRAVASSTVSSRSSHSAQWSRGGQPSSCETSGARQHGQRNTFDTAAHPGGRLDAHNNGIDKGASRWARAMLGQSQDGGEGQRAVVSASAHVIDLEVVHRSAVEHDGGGGEKSILVPQTGAGPAASVACMVAHSRPDNSMLAPSKSALSVPWTRSLTCS